MRWPFTLTREYLILRRDGEPMSDRPYRNETDARRDYRTVRGASLYRRWVIKPRSFRLIESKAWDEA